MQSALAVERVARRRQRAAPGPEPRPITRLSDFVCPERDCKLWKVRTANLLFTLGGRDQLSDLLAWNLTDGSRVADYGPTRAGDWTLGFEFSPASIPQSRPRS